MVGSNFRKIIPIIFSLIMFPKINVEKPWFSLVPHTHLIFFLLLLFLEIGSDLLSSCLNLLCCRCVSPHPVTQSPRVLGFLKVMGKVGAESSAPGAVVSRGRETIPTKTGNSSHHLTRRESVFQPIYRLSTYRICFANTTPLFITMETYVVCS